MLQFNYRMDSIAQIKDAAQQFLRFIENQPVKFVAFNGLMGAGKTTFINALLEEMKIDGLGSSPTFAIVNEYFSNQYGTIFHCDFYRLKSEDEAYDIGAEELVSGSDWVFAEWPEKLGNLLPEKIVNVKITDQNGCRIIEANV